MELIQTSDNSFLQKAKPHLCKRLQEANELLLIGNSAICSFALKGDEAWRFTFCPRSPQPCI